MLIISKSRPLFISMLQLLSGRSNVLLMGDEIGDAGMAAGVQDAGAVLKIGFLYERVSSSAFTGLLFINVFKVSVLSLESSSWKQKPQFNVLT